MAPSISITLKDANRDAIHDGQRALTAVWNAFARRLRRLLRRVRLAPSVTCNAHMDALSDGSIRRVRDANARNQSNPRKVSARLALISATRWIVRSWVVNALLYVSRLNVGDALARRCRPPPPPLARLAPFLILGLILRDAGKTARHTQTKIPVV